MSGNKKQNKNRRPARSLDQRIKELQELKEARAKKERTRLELKLAQARAQRDDTAAKLEILEVAVSDIEAQLGLIERDDEPEAEPEQEAHVQDELVPASN